MKWVTIGVVYVVRRDIAYDIGLQYRPYLVHQSLIPRFPTYNEMVAREEIEPG